MNSRQKLSEHLSEALSLSDDAISWLCDLWDLVQVFDDIADGDEVLREDLDAAIWAVLAGMPSNPFYQRNSSWLIPATAQMTLEWLASDRAERNGRAGPQPYMWRAGYYRVVCLVAALEHGPSAKCSEIALSLYGETLEEYSREFNIA